MACKSDFHGRSKSSQEAEKLNNTVPASKEQIKQTIWSKIWKFSSLAFLKAQWERNTAALCLTFTSLSIWCAGEKFASTFILFSLKLNTFISNKLEYLDCFFPLLIFRIMENYIWQKQKNLDSTENKNLN